MIRGAAVAALVAGCAAGPPYERPCAPLPGLDAYKEWKRAAPADAIPRGAWWTIFRDAELDALAPRVATGNQTVLQAIANYHAAAAQIRIARAGYWPTITAAPTVRTSRGVASTNVPGNATGVSVMNPGTTVPGTATTGTGTSRVTVYTLPVEATWAPDLFGRVRNQVKQAQYTAQARAADLANVRLLQEAMLAQTLFELRGQDAQITVLEETVAANEEIVELTRASYLLGIATESEVLQARLTLQTSRVQLTNAALARAQFEHAIATLIGVPASGFSLARRQPSARLPTIPPGAPSQLLERRPDVASAERQMAAANAAIGIGYAAYFPQLTLTGDAGFSSTTLAKLLAWPSRFWAVGGTLTQVLFDGGLRRATIDQARAAYDATVAAYRQTVLTAIQQVEDQLAAQRILAVVVEQQRIAVQVAHESFVLERARYVTGIDPYVVLMTQQTALLAARQALIALETQQLTAAVLLIQDLGGGWRATDLPSPTQVIQAR
ncbi:MAG: efflux transporter outer membrane subunit [Deltaproteobacteria bacterium]|nr:efflux transporter outer membrane subunit [Deltaproteobacteria bacterium]